MDPLTTGIVVSDDERLILRPFPLLSRRRELIGGVVGLSLFAVTMGALFFTAFRAHLDPVAVAGAVVAGACVMAYRISTQVTFIALRGGDGIYVETRNRILRNTRRRLLHRYADVTGLELRTRLKYVDILLHKRKRTALLWYTRYPESAAHIAETIARFANVSVRDSR